MVLHDGEKKRKYILVVPPRYRLWYLENECDGAPHALVSFQSQRVFHLVIFSRRQCLRSMVRDEQQESQKCSRRMNRHLHGGEPRRNVHRGGEDEVHCQVIVKREVPLRIHPDENTESCPPDPAESLESNVQRREFYIFRTETGNEPFSSMRFVLR